MLKRMALLFVLILGVFIISISAHAQEEAEEELPEADGSSLLEYILETNPYTEWGSFPADGVSDFHGIYLPGSEPHGSTVRIYVNDIGVTAVPDFDGELPPGTIVVKENYKGPPDNRGELLDLTVMYKVTGFNPPGNDWFWLKATGDGSEINAAGALAGCIDCHSKEGNVDYMMRYGFGKEPFISLGPVFPGPNGAQILAYIFEDSPYTEWASSSDYISTTSPHGQLVRLYANDIVRRAGELPLPAGSLIVSEGYAHSRDDPKLVNITVMYKIALFNPQAGDWFWIKAGPTGTLDGGGALNGCIECHGQPGHQDYTLSGDLPLAEENE